MPYVINRSNGSQLLVLDDAILDTSTSLGLVGRNYVGYGETQNENFVWLLENFANDNPPARPITGQLWYNTSSQSLKLYDGAEWKTAASADVSVDAPPGTPGSFWFNSVSKQLYVYNNGWILVGPETAIGFGETKLLGTTLNDTSAFAHPVLKLLVDDTTVGVFSKTGFTIGNTPVDGITSLTGGLTFAQGYNIKANLIGNASSADSLSQQKRINGVIFDGTQDITIRSGTSQALIRGTYLKGSNFDGTTARTWEVDASETATPGKVVARDSTGSTAVKNLYATLVDTTNITSSGTVDAETVRATTVQADTFIGVQLSGNALTATRLQTPPTINGVTFAGDQNITVSVAAENLLGTTLNNSIVQSALTSVGTLSALDVTANDTSGVTIHTPNQNLEIKATTLGDPLIATSSSLEIAVGTNKLAYVSASVAAALGADNYPMIYPKSTTTLNLGASAFTFRKVYAENFISNQVDTDFIRAKTPTGTITIGDDTIINGNLTVTGTTTTVNSSTVDIRDVNITLAKGAANQVAADGGGITVEGANAQFYYSATGNKWNINKRLDAGNNDIITTGYFIGTATAAQYADLAENYQADADYAPGTVLEFGGTFEVTLAEDETRRVAGVVSTKPAYLMNSELTGMYVVSIALQGRVPCKVRGTIRKGDMLTSGGNGYARPTTDPKIGTIIGKALENFNGIEGVIEVAVGRL